MSRPNLIVAGAVALAVIAAGAGLQLVLRRPHQDPPVAESTDGGVAAAPEASLRRPVTPRVTPPPRPRVVATDEPPVEADPPMPTPRSEREMLEQRRQLLATHFPQALREADERVFEKLGIPPDKRAAIRLLNERLTLLLAKSVPAPSDPSAPKHQIGGVESTTGNI